MQKILLLVSLSLVMVLFTGMNSMAAVEIDAAAIEAEIAAAVAAGAEPDAAAVKVLEEVMQAILTANPDYPGGMAALNKDIITALVSLNIPGVKIENIIVANAVVIEAVAAEAIIAGAEPEVAAKEAVVQVIDAIVAAVPEYPGGVEALQVVIFSALPDLSVTGLDTADVVVAANHALDITVDPEIEAYEAAQPTAETVSQPTTDTPVIPPVIEVVAPVENYGPETKPTTGSPT